MRYLFAAMNAASASRMPSDCGFLIVAGNPWPYGTRLASNISLLAARIQLRSRSIDRCQLSEALGWPVVWPWNSGQRSQA